MPAKVTVIVVNWNGLKYLSACLESLAGQTERDHEVYFVDNGSTDGSGEMVAEAFPAVRVIRNSHNRGFAAANNQAITASASEFVALLNNDAVADPDWLEQLLTAIESDPRVGSCASKMVFAHTPGIINSTGICLDKAGIAWDRWGGWPDDPDPSMPTEVFGACAGAALYRKSFFDDVGLFDEDFFAYLEDVDLAWRARLRGWRCLYQPGARVTHHHSATGKEGSPFKNYLLGRNKIWTVLKNYQMPAFARYLPAILIYDLLSINYSLLVRSDMSALRGRLGAFARIAKMLRKRRQIQSQATATPDDVLALMEPIVRPDTMARRTKHLVRGGHVKAG